MPFQSEKQKRYMHANLPDIAKRWERDYSGGGIAELNQELNSLPEYYMPFPAAQGGRIGAFNGGIQGLMPRRGRVVNPGGYAGTTYEDFLKRQAAAREKAGIGTGEIEESFADLEQGIGLSEAEIEQGWTSNDLLNKQLDELDIDRMEVQNEINKRQSEYKWTGKGDYQLELEKIGFKTKQEFINAGYMKGHAQGGRIGFDSGTQKDFNKFLNERKEAFREEDLDRLMEDYKRWLKGQSPQIEEAAQGGFIPAHEAGIYGLAEGGKIIDGQPHQLSYITPGEAQSLQNLGGRKVMTPEGIPAYPGHFGREIGTSTSSAPESTSGDGNGYQTVHDTGAITQTPGRTTTTTVEQDNGSLVDYDDYNYPGIGDDTKKDVWGPEDDAREKYISEQYNVPKKKVWDPEAGEWEEVKPSLMWRSDRVNIPPPKEKRGFWKTLGNIALALIPGLLPAKLATAWGIGKLGYEIKYTDKHNALIQKFTGRSKEDLLSSAESELKSKQDLYESLPIGHPEKIALQAELEIGKKPPTDVHEKDGAIQETSITIEPEEVNDAKTQLLRKYQEMNDASRLALQRQQQMNRDKQMAYYRMMMKPYFTGAAQGGRVPDGYNTGGLSNLFRLKNV